MKKLLLRSIFLVALLVTLVACQVTPPDTTTTGGGSYDETSFSPDQEIQPQPPPSETALKTFLLENSGSIDYSHLARSGGMMVVEDQAVSAPKMASGNAKVSTDFSETNNQVVGVDEGDIIKTDGEYIYTITDQTLFIIKAYPGDDAKIVATLKMKKGHVRGLFINDNHLVVYGVVGDYELLKKIGIPSSIQMTYVDVYDVSHHANPSLIKELQFEGTTITARMVDETAYVITQNRPDVSRPLPYIIEDGVVGSLPVSDMRIMPFPYTDVQYVSVNAVDISSFDYKTLTVAVELGNKVYMSNDNIYLAYGKYINELAITRKTVEEMVVPLLSEDDQQLISAIKKVDNKILTRAEKEQKIYALVNRYVSYLSGDEQDALKKQIEEKRIEKLKSYEYREYTVLNKVSVDGLDLELSASGTVPGQINNQFSLDEYDGVLRMATTLSPRWSNIMDKRFTSENLVITLDDDLNVIDQLDGIAQGESIYSSRFMGERLYLVTFRQVDPFFVIDLADPSDIKALGELKIPGFSRYLHPYDDHTIIGIGREASVSGRQQGLKISLFDVTDPKNPLEVAKYVNDDRYSQSGAEYEHKAFLFSKEKGLLVVPVYSYDWNSKEGYNGALVFDISRNEIAVRGLIDHSNDATKGWYAPQVERSLYIEDLLYTKSPNLLRINELSDLSSVANLTLKPSSAGDVPLY